MERAVAIDARMIAHSGIGTHVAGLLGGMRGLDGAPRIVLLGPPSLLASRPECAGFDVVPWHAPIYSAREQATFPAAELRRRGVAVVHSPHYNMPLRAGGLRRVVTIHDLIHLRFADHLGALARAYARFMLRQVVRRADALLTVSEHTRRDLAGILGADPARVAITPNAVDPAFARPVAAADIARVRGALELPPRYALTVGINKPHKNYPFLVGVMARLWATQRTDAHLVMAGIPRDESLPYRELVRETGFPDLAARLHFPGRVAWGDLPALYAGAALVVVPSLYEGFGLPVIEAQTHGVAVACANTTSLPEVGGDAAAYFDPRDADDAAAAIGALLTDDARRADLARRGPDNARRFSWRATAERVVAAYRDLLARDPRKP